MDSVKLKAMLCAAAFSFATTTAEKAYAVVGQPFLIAENDLNGSILDFFQFSAPSGQKELSVSGTVTNAFGADSAIGQGLGLTTSLFGASQLTFFGETLTVEDVSGLFFDPLQATPGLITFEMLVQLPIAGDIPDPMTPGNFIFNYDAPFDDFDGYSSDFPDPILEMSIYYNGDLPTRIFEEIFNGAVVDSYPYVEGSLDVTKITLGLVGGDPVPQVPLPASGFMLIGAIGLLASRRRT